MSSDIPAVPQYYIPPGQGFTLTILPSSTLQAGSTRDIALNSTNGGGNMSSSQSSSGRVGMNNPAYYNWGR